MHFYTHTHTFHTSWSNIEILSFISHNLVLYNATIKRFFFYHSSSSGKLCCFIYCTNCVLKLEYKLKRKNSTLIHNNQLKEFYRWCRVAIAIPYTHTKTICTDTQTQFRCIDVAISFYQMSIVKVKLISVKGLLLNWIKQAFIIWPLCVSSK